MFTKRELINFVIAILVLSFVFGFDDGEKTFDTAHWLSNLIKYIILITISLFIALLVQKRVAKSNNAKVEFDLWGIKRLRPLTNPLKKLKNRFPVGVILALLFSFVSNGKLFFTGVFTTNVTTAKSYIGRKYEFVTNYQEALILLSFPLTNIAIVLISRFLENSYAVNLSSLILVNIWIAGLNLLPIPGFIGGKIFFDNRHIYVFAISFVVLTIGLIKFGALITLILALLLSLFIVASYYYFADFGGSLGWPNLEPTQKFVKASKNLKKWQFIVLFLLLLIIFTFAGTNPSFGVAISAIGAFIVILAYYVLKK